MNNTAVYIFWDETEAINPKQTYSGGGCYHTEFEYHKITRRVRWDSTVSNATIAAAKEYAANNMDDGRENVRVKVVTD